MKTAEVIKDLKEEIYKEVGEVSEIIRPVVEEDSPKLMRSKEGKVYVESQFFFDFHHGRISSNELTIYEIIYLKVLALVILKEFKRYLEDKNVNDSVKQYLYLILPFDTILKQKRIELRKYISEVLSSKKTFLSFLEKIAKSKRVATIISRTIISRPSDIIAVLKQPIRPKILYTGSRRYKVIIDDPDVWAIHGFIFSFSINEVFALVKESEGLNETYHPNIYPSPIDFLFLEDENIKFVLMESCLGDTSLSDLIKSENPIEILISKFESVNLNSSYSKDIPKGVRLIEV